MPRPRSIRSAPIRNCSIWRWSAGARHSPTIACRAIAPAALERGRAVFTQNCASCHGPEGKGNRELGAPNLADQIWLYGGDKASIIETIANARNGSMPAWNVRLDPATIKMLTLYVHSLGGGE